MLWVLNLVSDIFAVEFHGGHARNGVGEAEQTAVLDTGKLFKQK
jgi:hypothetical protein